MTRGGPSSPRSTVARLAALMFGEPAGSGRRRTPGVYGAEVRGPEGRRVQIILLDTRTFKGPPNELSKTDEGPYPLYDLTSSGLTHVNEEYPKAPNRCRVAGPFVDLNFGLVEIEWDVEGGAVITLSIRGVQGQRVFERDIRVAALAPARGTGGRAW